MCSKKQQLETGQTVGFLGAAADGGNNEEEASKTALVKSVQAN